MIDDTYGSTVANTASSTSSEYNSVLVLPARSNWKMPKIGSTWLFATISAPARGMSDDSNRARAGTFPLDSHRVGESTGATKA